MMFKTSSVPLLAEYPCAGHSLTLIRSTTAHPNVPSFGQNCWRVTFAAATNVTRLAGNPLILKSLVVWEAQANALGASSHQIAFGVADQSEALTLNAALA